MTNILLLVGFVAVGLGVVCQGADTSPAEACSSSGKTAEQRWFGCKEPCPADWSILKQDPRGNGTTTCSVGTKSLCMCNCTIEWKGTSPFCKGECSKDATMVRKDKKGDGFSCLSGEKVLCRTCTKSKLPFTTGTTTRAAGNLRTEPSGLEDGSNRRQQPTTNRYPTNTPRGRYTADWDFKLTPTPTSDNWRPADKFTQNWRTTDRLDRFSTRPTPSNRLGCHQVWVGQTPKCNGWCPDGWDVIDKSASGLGWECSSGQKFRCQKCDDNGDASWSASGDSKFPSNGGRSGREDVAVSDTGSQRSGHSRASG